MTLLFIAFLSGVLTVLAPCVLPLLPIVLGASAEDGNNKKIPLVIIASLSISIILFSLLLKASTVLIGVPASFWKSFSGGMIIALGLITIFPNLWKTVTSTLGLSGKSNQLLAKSGEKKGYTKYIFMGFALGPVFSSCSPTYALILAIILPAGLLFGFIALIFYTLGLAVILLAISIFGQKLIKNLKWASDPNGLFKKILGVIFVLVGLAIISGFDKKIETAILDAGFINTTGFEQKIINELELDNVEDLNSLSREEDMGEQFGFVSNNLNTNTAKTSIDLELILDGGPGKDGIPAIDKPKFITQKQALKSSKYLEKDDLGIVLQSGGEARFYGYDVLVWHEIINDELDGQKIAVTFCPLCGSAIVYDREVNGRELQFGVSGKLYNSNLLMYDSHDESLWSQSLGEAVVGDQIGAKLTVLKSQLMNYSEFQKSFPEGLVLSNDTGYSRRYGEIPYGNYTSSDDLFFPVAGGNDSRFHAKDLFYIVNTGDESIAFNWNDLRELGEGKIQIGDDAYTAKFSQGLTDVTFNDTILPGYFEMWFSWISHNEGNKNIWSKNN